MDMDNMDDGKGKEFAVQKDNETGTLKNLGYFFVANFQNGEPKTVEPKEKDGVTTEVDDKDKTVTFTQKGGVSVTTKVNEKEKSVTFIQKGPSPAVDKTIEFNVFGGKDGKEKAVIKIIVLAEKKG